MQIPARHSAVGYRADIDALRGLLTDPVQDVGARARRAARPAGRSPFPGFHALAPCAGTALVIWSGSGSETAVKRLLSPRPVVFVGLISSERTVGHEARTLVILSETGDEPSDVAGNNRVLAGGLRRTLESPEGHDLFVVGSVPEVGYEVPEVLARMRFLGRGLDIRPGRPESVERQRPVRSLLDA